MSIGVAVKDEHARAVLELKIETSFGEPEYGPLRDPPNVKVAHICVSRPVTVPYESLSLGNW